MVAVMERLIQKIKPDKWDALEELNKKFEEVEARYDYPQKRRYRAGFSRLDTNVLVVEREWPSMRQFEESFVSASVDPDEIALSVELRDIVENHWEEVYMIWPPKM